MRKKISICLWVAILVGLTSFQPLLPEGPDFVYNASERTVDPDDIDDVIDSMRLAVYGKIFEKESWRPIAKVIYEDANKKNGWFWKKRILPTLASVASASIPISIMLLSYLIKWNKQWGTKTYYQANNARRVNESDYESEDILDIPRSAELKVYRKRTSRDKSLFYWEDLKSPGLVISLALQIISIGLAIYLPFKAFNLTKRFFEKNDIRRAIEEFFEKWISMAPPESRNVMLEVYDHWRGKKELSSKQAQKYAYKLVPLFEQLREVVYVEKYHKRYRKQWLTRISEWFDQSWVAPGTVSALTVLLLLLQYTNKFPIIPSFINEYSQNYEDPGNYEALRLKEKIDERVKKIEKNTYVKELAQAASNAYAISIARFRSGKKKKEEK